MPVSVLYFYGPNCVGCKQMTPIVDSLGVNVEKIDVEQNRQKANEFYVRSLPTLIICVNGRPWQSFIGVVSKSKVDEVIEKLRS